MDERTSIRAVVGEDEPIYREGLVHVLRAGGVDVVATADNARDLVRKTRAHAPDIALVDIQMPPHRGDDGLLAAKEIRDVEPPIAVLLLTHYLETRYALELFGDRPEGAGYLLKDRLTEAGALVQAVRRVAGGGSVVDPEVVSQLVNTRRGHDPIDDLSPRQLEVLALMAEGRSNRGIAAMLVVTVPAVERHVTRIFTTLGVPRETARHRRVLAVLEYLRRR